MVQKQANIIVIYLQLSARSKGRTAKLHVDHCGANFQPENFSGKPFSLIHTGTIMIMLHSDDILSTIIPIHTSMNRETERLQLIIAI